jgi:hypothetical protein
MAQATDPERQKLIDALPTTGRISYDEMRTKLLSTGQAKAVNRFHDMRRDGSVKAEIVNNPDGTQTLFISRP